MEVAYYTTSSTQAAKQSHMSRYHYINNMENRDVVLSTKSSSPIESLTRNPTYYITSNTVAAELTQASQTM